MKKRYLISAGVLAVCVCLTLAVLAMFPARPIKPGVTRVNIHRIEIGMTRAEVEAVLGRGGSPTGGPHLTLNGSKAFTWWGEHGTISLAFDDDGRVKAKQWDDRPSGTIPQRITRWLDSLRY